MKVIYSEKALKRVLKEYSQNLAFVPTMGALHAGHMSLVKQAQTKHLPVLVSIFVNPLQFNNSKDLEKYPRTIEADLNLLAKENVDFVYLPTFSEIYSREFENESIKLQDSTVETVFEGYFRPGHFDGVVQVLYRFFSQVDPSHVFFGQKDLQQCMVVKLLIDQYFPSIEFNMVPTSRELSGLAMSSRNARLSNAQLESASQIFITLKALRGASNRSTEQIKIEIERLKQHQIETEYLSYVQLPHFTEINEMGPNQALVFAGYLGEIRLIDNLLL